MADPQTDNLIKRWQDFVERHDKSNKQKIQLNPDREKVEFIAKNVLANEAKKGFKFCPCKITTGKTADDLKIICPCNFFAQKTWNERGDCWCSLFMKK